MANIMIADTDVIIDYFSGVEPIASTVGKLMETDRLAITSITVFELYAGVIGTKRIGQIDALLAAIRVYSFGIEEALVAVEIYNDLKKKGNLIGIEDILIAGICIAGKRKLLTRNKEHFSRIRNLELYKVT